MTVLHQKTKQNMGYMRLMIKYVIFCVIVLLIVTIILSRYISVNNTAQINNVLSLMSEKVNTSFEMMTDYIIEAADLMSARNEFSYEDSYDELQQTLQNMPYFSIGILDMEGNVYGSAGEQTDMEKQDLIDAANHTDTIYISEPYRSSVTGDNMITIFAPIYQNDVRAGSIFVTYYLETIQNLAYTNILSDETAVFLMNPYSGNFVNCSQDGGNPPGTWSNIRLIKNEIVCYRGYDYDTWISNMKSNKTDNIINFRQNDTAYTQAYIHITGMENWCLVIRMPITELSNTMQQYIISVAIGAALLILATMFLAATLYRREHDKSENLQMLSNADPLTKVMNRCGFTNTMKKMFSDKASLGKCVYMFLDIDLFKHINDQYGHETGDYVLCTVSEILTDTFQETGIVARVGGDEFNIFIYQPLSKEDLNELLNTLQIKCNAITLPDQVPLPVSFSAGLSVFPKDAKNLKDLMNCADQALYYVKNNGRKNHFWYEDLQKQT